MPDRPALPSASTPDRAPCGRRTQRSKCQAEPGQAGYACVASGETCGDMQGSGTTQTSNRVPPNAGSVMVPERHMGDTPDTRATKRRSTITRSERGQTPRCSSFRRPDARQTGVELPRGTQIRATRSPRREETTWDRHHSRPATRIGTQPGLPTGGTRRAPSLGTQVPETARTPSEDDPLACPPPWDPERRPDFPSVRS
jgi:hypothetical protein